VGAALGLLRRVLRSGVDAEQPARSRRCAWGFPGGAVSSVKGERGGTGIRAGLRILSRKGSGFDSRRSHSTT
jgi:hypothetical protein